MHAPIVREQLLKLKILTACSKHVVCDQLQSSVSVSYSQIQYFYVTIVSEKRNFEFCSHRPCDSENRQKQRNSYSPTSGQNHPAEERLESHGNSRERPSILSRVTAIAKGGRSNVHSAPSKVENQKAFLSQKKKKKKKSRKIE